MMLQENTVAPGGRHIEILGSYNPHSKEAILKEDRIKYWVSKGAQMSDTAFNLLVKNKVIDGDKRKVKVPAKKVEEKVEEVKNVKAEETSPVAEEVKTEENPSPVAEVKTEEAPKVE